jgi:hypothetical protein
MSPEWRKPVGSIPTRFRQQVVDRHCRPKILLVHDVVALGRTRQVAKDAFGHHLAQGGSRL